MHCAAFQFAQIGAVRPTQLSKYYVIMGASMRLPCHSGRETKGMGSQSSVSSAAASPLVPCKQKCFALAAPLYCKVAIVGYEYHMAQIATARRIEDVPRPTHTVHRRAGCDSLVTAHCVACYMVLSNHALVNLLIIGSSDYFGV